MMAGYRGKSIMTLQLSQYLDEEVIITHRDGSKEIGVVKMDFKPLNVYEVCGETYNYNGQKHTLKFDHRDIVNIERVQKPNSHLIKKMTSLPEILQDRIVVYSSVCKRSEGDWYLRWVWVDNTGDFDNLLECEWWGFETLEECIKDHERTVETLKKGW